LLDLFDGEEFKIQNKFLKELDTAIQAIVVLLTTDSPFAPAKTSLQEFKGQNITDDIRPEVSIKIDKVNTLITRDYPIIRSVKLESIEEDESAADGLIITLAVMTTMGVVYPEISL
jgi:hypothetical protein